MSEREPTVYWMTWGVCVNYHGRCSLFERPVRAVEGDTCQECGEALMHESGLTWADARAKGYQSAGVLGR